MSDALGFPTMSVVDGHLLASLKMKKIRHLSRKKLVRVLEVSTEKEESVHKVIKKIDSRGQEINKWLRAEISIMHNAQHPHVLKMDFAVSCGNWVAICMPLCSRGSLDKLAGRLTSDQVRRFIVQTACGLRYLHSRRFIHGDMKTANVFVDASDNAILGDFGQSRVLPSGQDTVTSWGGTSGYVGPEYTSRGDSVNAFLMDSYGLGATLWALLIRAKPSDWDLLGVVENVKLPDMERSVLANLVQPDPQHRLTANDVLQFFRTDEKLREIIDRL